MGRGVVLAVAAVLCACSRGGEAPAGELSRLMAAGERQTYRATYRYLISGPLAEAADTTVVVVRRGGDSLRLVETTTMTGPVSATFARWAIHLGGRWYTCSKLAEVTCSVSAASLEGFGYAQLDEIEALARHPEQARSVAAAPGATVAGERARCFALSPPRLRASPMPLPTPRFEPSRFRFEVCLAADGIPLRYRRTALGPIPSGVEGTRLALEAVAVRRTVGARDLELPGPLVSPRPPTPTPGA